MWHERYVQAHIVSNNIRGLSASVKGRVSKEIRRADQSGIAGLEAKPVFRDSSALTTISGPWCEPLIQPATK